MRIRHCETTSSAPSPTGAAGTPHRAVRWLKGATRYRRDGRHTRARAGDLPAASPLRWTPNRRALTKFPNPKPRNSSTRMCRIPQPVSVRVPVRGFGESACHAGVAYVYAYVYVYVYEYVYGQLWGRSVSGAPAVQPKHHRIIGDVRLGAVEKRMNN